MSIHGGLRLGRAYMWGLHFHNFSWWPSLWCFINLGLKKGCVVRSVFICLPLESQILIYILQNENVGSTHQCTTHACRRTNRFSDNSRTKCERIFVCQACMMIYIYICYDHISHAHTYACCVTHFVRSQIYAYFYRASHVSVCWCPVRAWRWQWHNSQTACSWPRLCWPKSKRCVGWTLCQAR